MKRTYTLSVLFVFGLVLVVTPGRTTAVTGKAIEQRKIVITGVDVGPAPTGVSDAVVYPNSTTARTDIYGYVAYDRGSNVMLVVGQPTQGGGPNICNYALVDLASGRLVRPAETIGDRVYAVGIDSYRRRAYLLLLHSTSDEHARTVLQSIDMRTGKTIARRTTYYQIVDSILADTAPINRIAVDPQSGNLFARMMNGDTAGLVELTPDGRTVTGRKFQSSPGDYTDAKDLEINGPGHQVIALVGDGSTLEFFDTRTLKASTRPLGYAPVKLALNARRNQLWALAPGGDVMVYNAVTGGVVAHIVDNDAAFNQAVGNGPLVTPVLAIDATRDVGYIGCRSYAEKGCSVDALYPDKRGRVLVDRGPVQLLGVDAGIRVEQDPPYDTTPPPTPPSFVHIYAPGRAPRTLAGAPVDRMDPESMSEFMTAAAGVTRIVWLGKIGGHNGLTGNTIDDGIFIDTIAR